MPVHLRAAAAAAALAFMVAAAPAAAENAAGLTSDLSWITADGTWDCKDPAGVPLGAVVVVDKAYAFIKTDGKVGGYGKLYRLDPENFDLPVFVVVDGYLKDALRAGGVAMIGPRSAPHDLSGQLFFKIVISDTNEPWCERREGK